MSMLTLNDTFTGKNISSAAVVYTYTIPANSGGTWRFQLAATVAGSGDYVAYAAVQYAGAGSTYLALPKTTATSAAGETTIVLPTISLDLSATDVISFYLDGLAGDTSVSGLIKGWLAEQAESATSFLTYTLTDSSTGNPIGDALIQVYTDVAMSNLIDSGYTSALGVITFYLFAGTYYLKRTKTGYSFTNPDTEVVT